jgi:hypothetical protein
MEETMEAAIESIITKKIPKGAMFDTHAVIERYAKLRLKFLQRY